MSDTEVAAWAALLRVHAALVPLIDRELQAACTLPLTWYDVLLELNAAPGRRLSMGELGEVAVGVDPRVALRRARAREAREQRKNLLRAPLLAERPLDLATEPIIVKRSASGHGFRDTT